MAGPEAVALLKVPWRTLTRGLKSEVEESGIRLFANDAGQIFGVRPLKDGTLVETFLGFFQSPDELSLGLGQLLGNTLDLHEDARGVFVFPDFATPEVSRYAEVVDGAATHGFWVPVAAPERVKASIEKRMEQVVEFMAQMTALNQATRAGDDKNANRARKAIARAFDDAQKQTVRTSHPAATQIRKGGQKALKTLQSAFEGVKLDDVQLAPEWQKAADTARTLIRKDLEEISRPKRKRSTAAKRKPAAKRAKKTRR